MNSGTPSVIRDRVMTSREAAIARALALGIPMKSILIATAMSEVKEELARIPELEALLKRASQSVAAMVQQREELIALANRNRVLYQSRLKALRAERDKMHNVNLRLNRENMKLREEVARLSVFLDD